MFLIDASAICFWVQIQAVFLTSLCWWLMGLRSCNWWYIEIRLHQIATIYYVARILQCCFHSGQNILEQSIFTAPKIQQKLAEDEALAIFLNPDEILAQEARKKVIIIIFSKVKSFPCKSIWFECHICRLDGINLVADQGDDYTHIMVSLL